MIALKKNRKFYIGRLVNRLNDKESARELRGHPSSLIHNIRTSCYNHTSSKRKPIVPGENALSWSSLADMFASVDYSIVW